MKTIAITAAIVAAFLAGREFGIEHLAELQSVGFRLLDDTGAEVTGYNADSPLRPVLNAWHRANGRDWHDITGIPAE